MKRYKLLSTQAVIPVIVQYEEEESGDKGTAVAYVNYGQDMVWFPNNPELETDEIRRVILAGLDTIFPTEVHMPPEIMRQIEQIRQGNYGHEIPGFKENE